jgi:hypothetical protein
MAINRPRWIAISFSSIPKLGLQNYNSLARTLAARFTQTSFYSPLVSINKPLVAGRLYFRDPACNKFTSCRYSRSDSKIFLFTPLATPTRERDLETDFLRKQAVLYGKHMRIG